jgi:hypothetical protein
LPTLSWVKRIGLPDLILINIAISAIGTARIIKPKSNCQVKNSFAKLQVHIELLDENLAFEIT